MTNSTSWVLAADIDHTLTGDDQALQRLAYLLAAEKAQGNLFLILSTGRNLNQVVNGFSSEGIPEPNAVITQVGTEIFLPPFTHSSKPLLDWDAFLKARFSRKNALAFLSSIEGLVMQPSIFNTPLKVSCFLDRAENPSRAVSEIQRRIADANEEEVYQVIWSSGRDLDIIPTAAGKGNAIHYLIQFLALDSRQVVVAGDSGNDCSMFKQFERGIVVANAQPELKQFAKSVAKPGIYFARQSFAAGVEEGLRHFGLLP